jgi:hypothetical protein
LLNGRVNVCSKNSLVGLVGRIHLNTFTFMLDSGASASFIPERLVATLALRYKN